MGMEAAGHAQGMSRRRAGHRRAGQGQDGGGPGRGGGWCRTAWTVIDSARQGRGRALVYVCFGACVRASPFGFRSLPS